MTENEISILIMKKKSCYLFFFLLLNYIAFLSRKPVYCSNLIAYVSVHLFISIELSTRNAAGEVTVYKKEINKIKKSL